jgi:uncharacterized membrane protein
MSDKKQSPVQSSVSIFTKDNYTWMIAGIVVIALGMLLMAGGKSNNPAEFNQKEVYSTTRITIAPLLIIIGLGLEVFAIFKKTKNNA